MLADLGDAHTIGVIGIDVGVGGVPALDQPVSTTTVTLLATATHHHTEHRTSGRFKSISGLNNYLVTGLTKNNNT